jgi:dihydrofolate synthase/folylpolyglutamate synthase
MNYKQTLDLLYNMLPDYQHIGAGAYKPGLERAEAFNRYLGRPDRDFASIHIAGTNGKGSVAHMLASILQSAGYRVGLYTSPHMKDFRERIKVDGTMISETEVIAFTERHLDKMRELNMSFFEATMGMAFSHFADNDVEVAVVETGLGGRLDSTNILKPILSIITNIGMDHMAYLGDTIEKIAAEKAGIIKPETPVVIGESDPSTTPVFRAKAEEAGAPIFFAEDYFKCLSSCSSGRSQQFVIEDFAHCRQNEYTLDLMGGYQCRNMVTVMETISVLNHLTQLTISARSTHEGLASAASATGLRGRWEILGENPLTVCDTGHNEHGLRQVTAQIAAQQYDRLYMVIGVVNDKDLHGILPLMPKDAHYIFTQSGMERALPADALAAAAAEYGLHGEIIATVPEALAHARALATPRDMIFVGGSTFTVAEIVT